MNWKTKRLVLTALAVSSGTFLTGCLGALWQGWSAGWPAGNRWLNLALDIAKEVTIYTQ